MQLKRKRSESELSFASSSAFSSPPRPFDAHTFSFHSGDMMLSSPPPYCHQRGGGATPSHLPSRTMKRFRDSRPSDEEVHQRTLNLLFSAQQRQQHQQTDLFAGYSHQQHQSQPVLAQPPAPMHQQQQHHQPAQKSLHSFWSLPSSGASTAASLPPISRSIDAPTDCEDCGQGLRDGAAGGDTMDMDTDGFGAEAETSCGACGKHVCSHCSITNLGEQRRCLICAGRKVWVGGLGWTGAGVGVC